MVIFSYVEPKIEDKLDPDQRDLEKQHPKLEFFEEIFAYDLEFNFQKCVDVQPRINAIEWLNKGYRGKKPQLLIANEKHVKLY